MKDHKTQLAFIEARAEGKSFDTITKELNISKGTCCSWEKSLHADIEALKDEHLEELYTTYKMTRDARIKSLGEILQNIDTAIAKKTLEDIPADKLLELRLKYSKELKEEYKEPIEINTDDTLDGLLEQYNQLYNESKSGTISPADIKAQLSILDARKDTIYQLAREHTKEEGEDPFSFDLNPEYISKVIRH